MGAKSARRAQMRNGPFPKAGRTPKVRWAAGSGLPARVFLGVLLTVRARQEISSDALHRVYVRNFSQVEFHSVMTVIHFICRPEGLRADEARDTCTQSARCCAAERRDLRELRLVVVIVRVELGPPGQNDRRATITSTEKFSQPINPENQISHQLIVRN